MMIFSPLPHFNQRPDHITIDTFIIHSISAGDGNSAASCIQLLDQNQVSAHYLITQEGILWQLVEERHRAWHAGVSRMPFSEDPREGVNDFSIGAELITSSQQTYSEQQYVVLAKLIEDASSRHPIRYILGHDQIAPDRKTDPGKNFDWEKLRTILGGNFLFG